MTADKQKMSLIIARFSRAISESESEINSLKNSTAKPSSTAFRDYATMTVIPTSNNPGFDA